MRLEDDKVCLLVLIGVTMEGQKELLAVESGFREEWPSTREQRCWVHKTANVLNNLPKSIQPNAKAKLHEIWMAPTRAEAIKAYDIFLETYGVKYDKARDCLKKDRDELLKFYDFPAEHWKHLRTRLNPRSRALFGQLRQAVLAELQRRRDPIVLVNQVHAEQRSVVSVDREPHFLTVVFEAVLLITIEFAQGTAGTSGTCSIPAAQLLFERRGQARIQGPLAVLVIQVGSQCVVRVSVDVRRDPHVRRRIGFHDDVVSDQKITRQPRASLQVDQVRIVAVGRRDTIVFVDPPTIGDRGQR